MAGIRIHPRIPHLTVHHDWHPGDCLRIAVVVCCPACGSMRCTRTHTRDESARWRCEDCDAESWTLPREHGNAKARV